MPDLSYPTHHISVRALWHDNGWNGSVCKDPKFMKLVLENAVDDQLSFVLS